jgi:hypothetical protein
MSNYLFGVMNNEINECIGFTYFHLLEYRINIYFLPLESQI